MKKLGAMVDLALTPEELKANSPVIAGEPSNQPIYPYGHGY